MCALLVAALLAGGLTGWMLFQHIPAWYAPVQVPAADLQGVKDDLIACNNAFDDRMQAGGVFEFRITQDRLNAWLSAREQMWPAMRKWVPPMMEDPFIGFEPGRVVLAGTVTLGGVRTVLSVRLRLDADDKGLLVRLTEVRAGSLPVPAVLVREPLRQIDAHTRNGREAASKFPLAEDLLAGVHVPAEFVWWADKRHFRVCGVRVEPGAITFRVEPLPRHLRGSG
ncbi:MAG TPA: hypothetical protein PLC79_12350 [Phycisphaerae bacterium]|nr:hypothetical protein [Phycisphaerae bacterium]